MPVMMGPRQYCRSNVPGEDHVLTEIHDVVSADGAVVHHNVPSPERHGVPLKVLGSALQPCFASYWSLLTFLTSKRFLPSFPSPPAPFFLVTGAAAAGASVISTSAMVDVVGWTVLVSEKVSD